MSTWAIRTERPGDEAAVAALTFEAFDSPEHSGAAERAMVERLRIDGDLTLSLLAVTKNAAVIGHVAFSPVTIDHRTSQWFGLGPVSVAPANQREGVGSALIRDGLARLEGRGAAGCVVLGNPAYYGRFGFGNDPALTYPGPSARYFQRLVLRGDPPTGVVEYAPAFG